MNTTLARKVVYPLLFRLRGENVLGSVAEFETGQWLDAATVQGRQLKALQGLLHHVEAGDSPLARKYAEHGVQAASMTDLSELARFPVMEKADLHECLVWLKSRPGGLGRHDIRLSGGSTGDPCLVLADRHTSARSLAARILCQGWHGISLGDRQIRCWGRSSVKDQGRNRLKDLLLNRIRVDSLALENDHLDHTLERIRRFGVEFLYGYTSLIQLMADQTEHQDRDRIFAGLKAVIATSETLLPAQKAELERHFQVPVVLEYGCSEVDIISFSCPEGGQHVVADNLIVEVVRFGDEPEGVGQVVVTDLNNTLMPIIRYRVGDLVPLESPSCSCGRGWPCLGQIVGRSQGQYILVAGHRRVHSQFVVYLIEDLMASGVVRGRFRIVQKAPDLMQVMFAHQAGTDPASEELAAHFRRECRDVLGPDMAWEIQFVDPGAFETDRVNKYKHFQGLEDG